MDNKFSKGKIYCIKNKLNNKSYVGSTISTLNERFGQHKSWSEKKATTLYKAFKEFGIDNFEITLLEEFPCKSRKELLERESHYIRSLNTIDEGYNMYLAGRTREERKVQKALVDKAYRDLKGQSLLDQKKEYYQKNRERIITNNTAYQQEHKEARQEYMKNYAKKNKEKLAEYHKQYYELNKNKVLKNI